MSAIWLTGILVLILGWTYILSRNVIRAIERQKPSPSEVPNALYPVFSESEVTQAYQWAVEKSRALQLLESALYNDARFKESAQQHSIPEDVARRMLEVSEAVVDAESAWYRHSALMDANLSVVTAKATREEAFDIAKKRFEITNKPFRLDGHKLRDEWRSQLEDSSPSPKDPSPRPYSNPWFEAAKNRLHWMRA